MRKQPKRLLSWRKLELTTFPKYPAVLHLLRWDKQSVPWLMPFLRLHWLRQEDIKTKMQGKQ